MEMHDERGKRVFQQNQSEPDLRQVVLIFVAVVVNSARLPQINQTAWPSQLPGESMRHSGFLPGPRGRYLILRGLSHTASSIRCSDPVPRSDQPGKGA